MGPWTFIIITFSLFLLLDRERLDLECLERERLELEDEEDEDEEDEDEEDELEEDEDEEDEDDEYDVSVSVSDELSDSDKSDVLLLCSDWSST